MALSNSPESPHDDILLPDQTNGASGYATGSGAVAGRPEGTSLAMPVSGLLTSVRDIHEARVLVGHVYSSPKNQYVSPGELTAEGYLPPQYDPYVGVSEIFGIRTRVGGPIAVTARLIHLGRVADYPSLRSFKIHRGALPRDRNPVHFVEVSALARNHSEATPDDLLGLYADMLVHSINAGRQYWLMSVDRRLVKRLDILFGKGTFQPIGDMQHYMGSQTLPMMLDLGRALERFDRAKHPDSSDDPITAHINGVFRERLNGVDFSLLDPRTRGLVEAALREPDRMLRIIGSDGNLTLPSDEQTATKGGINPRVVGLEMGLLALWCTARDIPLVNFSGLARDGVQPLVFYGADLATIPTYAIGLEMLTARHASLKTRVAGLGMAAVSFASPYTYAYLAARQSPDVVRDGLVFAGTAGALMVGKPALKWTFRQLRKVVGQGKQLPAQNENMQLDEPS